EGRERGDGDSSGPFLDDGDSSRPQAADGVDESPALVFELGATVVTGGPAQSLAGSQDDGRTRLRTWRTQRSDAVSGSLERMDDADQGARGHAHYRSAHAHRHQDHGSGPGRGAETRRAHGNGAARR